LQVAGWWVAGWQVGGLAGCGRTRGPIAVNLRDFLVEIEV